MTPSRDLNCLCEMSIDPECTILVTGFGPFDQHRVNASWKAVKELEKLWIDSKQFSNIKLIVEEIPVSYSYVSTQIPQLWKKHNPIVSSITYDSSYPISLSAFVFIKIISFF